MPSNVEIKARVADVAALERLAASLADSAPCDIGQRDTFFHASRGRLKLREFRDGSGELIWYERPDLPGPKTSSYRIAPLSDASRLRECLALALGIRGTVRKERRLYLHGRTRIHVDRVEDLGDFVELEVVLREGESSGDGCEIALQLLRRLGVEPAALVEGAYVDLLEAKEA